MLDYFHKFNIFHKLVICGKHTFLHSHLRYHVRSNHLCHAHYCVFQSSKHTLVDCQLNILMILMKAYPLDISSFSTNSTNSTNRISTISTKYCLSCVSKLAFHANRVKPSHGHYIFRTVFKSNIRLDAVDNLVRTRWMFRKATRFSTNSMIFHKFDNFHKFGTSPARRPI